jgi:WD40 repeat protein
MKCRNCANEVEYGDRFCGDCGAPTAHAYESLSHSAVSSTPAAPVISGRVFPGHTKAANHVALSRDGRFSLSAGRDGYIRLCDVNSAREVRHLFKNGEACSATFSPDSRFALVGWSSDLFLWNVDSWTEKQRIDTRDCANATFSKNGQWLIGGEYGGSCFTVWNTANWKKIRTIELGDDYLIQALAISPDGRRAAVSLMEVTRLPPNYEGGLRLYDVPSGNEVFRLYGGSEFSHDTVFSDDGSMLLSSSYSADVWDIGSVQLKRSFVERVAFSVDSRCVLGSRGFDSSDIRNADFRELIWMWEINTGREFARLAGTGSKVDSLAVGGDGRHVIAGCEDGTVILWNLPS